MLGPELDFQILQITINIFVELNKYLIFISVIELSICYNFEHETLSIILGDFYGLSIIYQAQIPKNRVNAYKTKGDGNESTDISLNFSSRGDGS